MASNGLFCADVPLRNYSLPHYGHDSVLFNCLYIGLMNMHTAQLSSHSVWVVCFQTVVEPGTCTLPGSTPRYFYWVNLHTFKIIKLTQPSFAHPFKSAVWHPLGTSRRWCGRSGRRA